MPPWTEYQHEAFLGYARRARGERRGHFKEKDMRKKGFSYRVEPVEPKLEIDPSVNSFVFCRHVHRSLVEKIRFYMNASKPPIEGRCREVR